MLLVMARNIVVQLTDDLQGGEADETVNFALDGEFHEIDLNAVNAAEFRNLMSIYIKKGRPSAQAKHSGKVRAVPSRTMTLFSQLDAQEKSRFRRWANMPNARRIGDTRVQEWIDSGKP
jgi:hypothetical protein